MNFFQIFFHKHINFLYVNPNAIVQVTKDLIWIQLLRKFIISVIEKFSIDIDTDSNNYTLHETIHSKFCGKKMYAKTIIVTRFYKAWTRISNSILTPLQIQFLRIFSHLN